MPEIIVEKGETAHLSMVVCADPRPRVVAWEWGSLRLEEGNEMGKLNHKLVFSHLPFISWKAYKSFSTP